MEQYVAGLEPSELDAELRDDKNIGKMASYYLKLLSSSLDGPDARNLTSRQSFDGFSGFIHKYNSALSNMTLEDGGSTWGDVL